MNDDLLDIFLIEAREFVTRAQDDLVALESRPRDAGLLDDLFRSVHTLKGSVGLFDWPDFAQMLHAAEDLLSLVRSGEARVDAGFFEALDACLSSTERCLDILETVGSLPAQTAQDAAHVARRLKDLLNGAGSESGLDSSVPGLVQDPADELIARALKRGATLPASFSIVTYTPRRDCFFVGQDPVTIARNAPGLVELIVAEREPWGPLAEYDPFACNLIISLLSSAARSDLDAAFVAVIDQVTITERQSETPLSDPGQTLQRHSGRVRTLRIDAERVDALANAVDEMIVSSNALSQLASEFARTGHGEGLVQKLRDKQAAIARTAAHMHATVTSLRLVPIGPTFRGLPRTARDLSARLRKLVDITLDCEEIEADKSVVDGLSEPLLHILRNAVDHGVESPQERLEKGKPERARIVVSARRVAEEVIVTIADDGRGMDPQHIRAVARERAILPADALESLSDRETLDLVFRAGFSTAAEVSDVSGRGVGMDAVRSAIARLGGRVDLDSRPGVGTTVTLAAPLRVVLSQIAVVDTGDGVFGVPMRDVIELARVPKKNVMPVRNGRAFVLRDRPVPVVSLRRLLGRPDIEGELQDLHILVLQAGDEWIGVAVDRLLHRFEAVVRPMRGLLTGMRGLSGTTLMGDGSVLIVLDVPELIG